MATLLLSIYYLVKFYREYYKESLTGDLNVRHYLSILACVTPEEPMTTMENEVFAFQKLKVKLNAKEGFLQEALEEVLSSQDQETILTNDKAIQCKLEKDLVSEPHIQNIQTESELQADTPLIAALRKTLKKLLNLTTDKSSKEDIESNNEEKEGLLSQMNVIAEGKTPSTQSHPSPIIKITVETHTPPEDPTPSISMELSESTEIISSIVEDILNDILIHSAE